MQYPASDLDRPDTVASLLGSHWTQTYDGAELLRLLTNGVANLAQQNLQDFSELLDCTGRRTVPKYHRERWLPLVVLESSLQTDGSAVFRYGEDGRYGDGLLRYGENDPRRPVSMACDPTWAECPLLVNRFESPSLTWAHGVDFWLDKRQHRILFRQNPFDNDLLPVQEIVSGNLQTDRAITLWAFQVGQDHEYIHRHFGYLLNTRQPTSDAYRDLVNAALDSVVGGTAWEHLQQLVEALTGIPKAAHSETVELVQAYGDELLVATGRSVYKFPGDSVPIVEVGDRLQPGDAMVDTVEWLQFNRGQLPADVRAISASTGWLPAGYFGDLTFLNEETALAVEPDVDGFTKVSFNISGFSADVTKFWSDLHARGVARGFTLAMALDTRENPTTQPLATNLPATVKPAELLVKYVLRNNAVGLRIRGRSLGKHALGLEHGWLLRRMVPPQVMLLVLLELEGSSPPVIMDGTHGPAVQDEVNPFQWLEPISETVSLSSQTYLSVQPLQDLCL